jgi:hypothetical protein
MAKLVVIGPNLPGNTEQTHVHAAGCADTRKGIYRHHQEDANFVVELDSFRAVVEYVYPPSDFGYDPETELGHYSSDIKVFPCVKF